MFFPRIKRAVLIYFHVNVFLEEPKRLCKLSLLSVGLVPLPKVNSRAVVVCYNLVLDKVSKSIENVKAWHYMYFSARTPEEGLFFGVVISEKGTWQKQVTSYLNDMLRYLEMKGQRIWIK